MLSCGVDIVELNSFSKLLELGGDNFLERIFTQRELSYCLGQVPRLAARFAAKEACAKALGTGIRGVTWHEMEVFSDPRGKPLLSLSGDAANRVAEIKATSWSLSLSHSEGFAIAFVVMAGGVLAEELQKSPTEGPLTY
jgi:holo-[acyl-carrier protein] synthase